MKSFSRLHPSLTLVFFSSFPLFSFPFVVLFFSVHFSFHLFTPLSLFSNYPLLLAFHCLFIFPVFPLNIKKKKKQVREEQHPLAVWLAEILDLLLLLHFSEQWNLSDDLLSWMLRDPLNVIGRNRDQDRQKVKDVMKGGMVILYEIIYSWWSF